MKQAAIVGILCSVCSIAIASSGLTSIDTRAFTISKVRTAMRQGQSYIVASSYHGTILAIGCDGTEQWKHELSGFMNHDIWCQDITGNGNDEILAANADGAVYCLDAAGKLVWTFKPNDAPMRSVCVVTRGTIPYVVCGGYDNSFYYVSNSGRLVKKIHSSPYSKEKTWGKGPKRIPPNGIHSVNFLRRIRAAGGKELLVVHGVINSNAGAGSLYFFSPLADKPDRIVKLTGGPYGDMRVCDTRGDGLDEILLGTSNMIQDSALNTVHPGIGEQHLLPISEQTLIRNKLDRFGYRVLQPEIVKSEGRRKLMLLFGSRIILLNLHNQNSQDAEVLTCRYSFNDMWRDPSTEKIIDAAVGKKVVIIFPELEDPSEDFAFVLDDLIFPLAEYCWGKNANVYVRCKHLFWQTSIYEPMWSRLLSGEFSDVIVPAMEETTDKTMELSLASRMGLWASGVVDDWGARCARDNTSFDRLRQHSHQMLPNHFRLTLIDSGYINPGDKTATITFHTVTPLTITDLLANRSVATENKKSIRVNIPCGLFRFIDIEIKEAL